MDMVLQVCLVGNNQYNSFGSHGACEHVSLRHFPTIESCVDYLKQCGKCCGSLASPAAYASACYGSCTVCLVTERAQQQRA